MGTAAQQLRTVDSALQQLRSDTLTVAAFSQLARAQTLLLSELPVKFGTVLQHLLDRLESAALFSEESCSFSQTDLLDSLQQWVDHAQGQLDKGVAP